MSTQLPDHNFTSAIQSVVTIDPLNREWPAPLQAAAFHGLSGEIFRLLEPHTEADPATILAEADRHSCNLFAAIVDETSKPRKGTSSWVRKDKLRQIRICRRLLFHPDEIARFIAGADATDSNSRRQE